MASRRRAQRACRDRLWRSPWPVRLRGPSRWIPTPASPLRD